MMNGECELGMMNGELELGMLNDSTGEVTMGEA